MERALQRVWAAAGSHDVGSQSPGAPVAAISKATSPAVMAGVVEAAPDGVVLCDQEGTIVLANRQMELMFGYSRSALLDQPIEILVPARHRSGHRDHRALFAADAEHLMGMGFPLFGLRHDGSEFPVEISLSLFETAEGRFTIARVRDVSAKVAADMRLVEAERHLAVLEDRQRIARDLHDRVIQRLFAAGMATQSILRLTSDDVARQSLERTVQEIDTAILDLRSSVFELASCESGPSLRAKVLEICAEMRPALGLAPRVRFSGPVEIVDARVRDSVLPVLREALANVARHAQATSVLVTMVANGGLRLVVEDDGVGVDERREGSGQGLGNMASRASALGGTFAIGRAAGNGTRLEWHVPG